MVNAEGIKALADSLPKIESVLQDGECEGFAKGCKWWMNVKEVEED